ncbi:ribosome small subunit-dependent GTPase A, partial [Chloroflexota bacterium]
MARKKRSKEFKPKYRQNPYKGVGGFFRFLFSTPMRQIILVAVIVVVLFWQWSNIQGAWANLVDEFGWGLLFILAAILTFIFLIWRRKLMTLILRGNRWLGAAALVLAVWGILGFLDLGGNFGREVIRYHSPEIIGALRVAGLAVLGIILIFPKGTLRTVGKVFVWFRREFQRRPAPSRRASRAVPQEPSAAQYSRYARPGLTEKPPLMPEMQKPVMPPEIGSTKRPAYPDELVEEVAQRGKEKAAARTAASRSREELRQVAADVWKKYGQSPDLVIVDGWKLPPVEILDTSVEVEFSEADNAQRAHMIEEALGSYGVEAKVVQINAGPTVTQFGVEPGWDRRFKEVKERDRDGNVQIKRQEMAKTRVKVERITSLSNDLALALAAPSIRIEAPVPGKPVVGIEVPNKITSMVSLRGVVETATFQKLLAKSKMALALGQGAGGEAVAADLTKMPHLLIAGATGSGKTVCLNAIICCLMMHNTPDEVRFIMVDPKRVELTPYNSIPHLSVPVIVDTKKALNALRWLSQEMDQRYQRMASAGARNIENYNRNKSGSEKMSYLVLVIDELADLMMAGFDEVESTLCRLAQLARATGIHLVVATQRPSVDVVTGLIKANFPTRISFAVTSQVDSRTILDIGGAEKLLGKKIDYQMIAANIDIACIVQSCDFNFNLRRLERYLVMVHDGGITPLVLLSKSDLISPEELQQKISAVRDACIDTEVIAYSVKIGAGLEQLQPALVAGKTYCLLGSSGVGKSTLLNRLLGQDAFETNLVRAKDGKGRHTTSRRQLVVLDGGAMLVDTPGMRELGNIGMDTGISESFSDIMALSRECRFTD